MAGDYIIHKAVEATKVKKGFLKPLDYYEQQAKRDGCCAILFFDKFGRYGGAQSRTGEQAQSMDGVGLHVQEEWRGLLSTFSEGVAIIGEAWWPGQGEFNKISGEFRRYAVSDRLRLVANDAIPMPSFMDGYCTVPYSERVKDLRGFYLRPTARAEFTPWWPAGSADPQERCNELVALGGHDGLILRDPLGHWTVGRGTTGEIIKVKQKLSFDLRVLELNTVTGAKTGRPVYKMVVDFRGQRLGVGSGMPHNIDDCPKVGDIVEIEAMDYSSDGLLREPRYKGVRFDKLAPDG